MKVAIKRALWEMFSGIMKTYHFIVPRLNVTKKLYGIRFALNINDHISFLLSPFDWEPHIRKIVTQNWGVVWDVGSNFGLFSILAEKVGNNVVAFDPSELAIQHLNKTKEINRCTNLTTVSSPLAPEKIRYKTVNDASCTTVLSPLSTGSTGLDAITYREAAAKYGLPNLIKMDIEGGEKGFLEHPGFMHWLDENKIALIVELHNGYVPSMLDPAHVRKLSCHHILYSTRSKSLPPAASF